MTSTVREKLAGHEHALALVVGGIVANVADVYITLAITKPIALEANPIVLALGWGPWLVVKTVLLVGFVVAWWLGRDHRYSTVAAAVPLPLGLFGALGNASASGFFATDHGSVAVLASLVAVSLPLFVSRRTIRSALPLSRLSSLNRSSLRVVAIVAIALMLAISPVLPWLGGVGVISPDYSPVQIASADVENSTFNSSLDVSTEDTFPTDVTFNDDGSKMFMVGAVDDNIDEYSLSNPYDVTSATLSQTVDVSAQANSPTSISFNEDGSKLFISGDQGANIYEYSLSTAFDVSTLTYIQSLDVSSQDTSPNGVTFNGDGSKMFISGSGSNKVHEYSLSTTFDISSATYSKTYDTSTEDTAVTGVTFNGDGSLMFVPGSSNNNIFEYSLSTPFDISSATLNNSFNASAQDNNIRGVTFNGDGSKMFIPGAGNDNIYEYDSDISGFSSTVSGTVTNESGSAISGATVEIEDSTGAVLETHTTDTNGQWSTELGDGDYTAVTSASGYNTNTKAFSVSGSAVTVDQVLSKTKYSVEGYVLDGDGDPVGNSTVEISDDTGVITSTQANGAGKYTASLENGTYTAEASKKTYFNGSRTLDVAGPLTAQNITLGRHTLSGQVTNQAGDPVKGATVTAYAAAWANLSVEANTDKLEGFTDPTPSSWRDLPDDPDLTSTDGLFSPKKVDSYVSTHSGDVLPSTAPWLDTPRLADTVALDLPANEEIVLAAWDADASGLGTNRCIPGVGSEYDCQMIGKHKGENTEIVIERITAKGEVVQNDTIRPTESSGSGYFDPDSFAYATVELPPGFYYIHEKGAPLGPPRKVGTFSGIIDRYQKNVEGQLTDAAKDVQQALEANDMSRLVTTTDANGRYEFSVPANAKVVTVQALRAPGLDSDPTQVTQSMIVSEYNDAISTAPGERTDLQDRLVNSSVYFPSRVKHVEPPSESANLRLYELKSPPGANVTALQDQLQALKDLIKNGTFTELPPALQQRLEEEGLSELRATYSELVGLVRSYPPVKEAYLRISERDSIAPPSELSKSELRTEINAMNQALYQTDLTGSIDEGEVTRAAENVSLSWSVPGMDLDNANVSVIAHYANGSSRIVSDEYIAIDSSMFGTDVVRVEDYPLGETDPASVQFQLRVAGEDELRESSETVRNPSFSGELPRLDSISVSSLTPGPDDRVTVTLNPATSGSYKSLANVTVIGPDGNEITTSPVEDGRTFAFSTNGAGVYRLELEIGTTNGETVTLPVRIKAFNTDLPRPPSITVRDSPIGTYALAGDGLSGASVLMDNGGAQTTVVAKLGEGDSTPSNIDVHMEELSLPGDATTTVQLVRGEDEQQVAKNVPVTLHLRKTTEDALIRVNDKPVTEEGTRYGRAYTTSSGMVVDTYTDSSGSATVEKINNPKWDAKALFWLDVQLLNLPFATVVPVGLEAPSVVLETVDVLAGVVEEATLATTLGAVDAVPEVAA